MKITDALLGEHAIMYELFSHVRETIENCNEIAEVSGAILILDKLLLSHVVIEDELLFPEIESRLGSAGPISVMRSEHRQIEDYMEAAKTETDINAFKVLISEFLDLVYSHFHKEEMALFAIAQQVLDEVTLEDLGQQWAKRRNVTIRGESCLGAA